MNVTGSFGRFQIAEVQVIHRNRSPKPARPRYQKIRELGHNRAGGRVTYLATGTATGEPVVIKQFQFAQSGSEWSGFKTFEREIEVLRSLNHPGIPRYLDSFETQKASAWCRSTKTPLPWRCREASAQRKSKRSPWQC
jgi:serine/threonine protein kinase